MANEHLIGGRYRGLRPLGAGGQGNVWQVVDVVTGRGCALKFLNANSPEALARFRRELRLLEAGRAHPNIVQLLDANLDNAPPYIVMELCEDSLRSWVGRNPPWNQVAGAIAHALSGLTALHDAGGFHRDLKPDNLLLARDPATPQGLVLKLGDLGFAQVPGVGSSPMTRFGYGTPGYFAPEIEEGDEYSASADIYSLGVTVVEVLTGERSTQHLGQVAMPQAMRTLIQAMLSKQPAARPTAAVIAHTLNKLLATPNTVASPAPPPEASDGASLLWGSIFFAGALFLLSKLGEGGAGGSKPPVGG